MERMVEVLGLRMFAACTPAVQSVPVPPRPTRGVWGNARSRRQAAGQQLLSLTRRTQT